MTDNKHQDWDKLVLASSNHPNYMQSESWAKTKESSSWKTSYILIDDARPALPLQVFSRSVPSLGKVHYAPQVSGVSQKNIDILTKAIKKQCKKGIVFKLELYQPYSQELISAFQKAGWKRGNSVQYRDSVDVDLSGTEEDMFLRLKRRARYEVRVAQRNGVKVEKVAPGLTNFNKLAELLDITSKRTGAFIRPRSYLFKYWKIFSDAGLGDIYFVRHKKTPLAGTFIIKYGSHAWYKDSGSTGHENKLMASRFMLWEIMRDLQKQGIKSFDLSGIAAQEDLKTSSLAGLNPFKTGFSNDTVKYMPALELPLSVRYKLWPQAESQYLRLYSKLKKDFWY